MNRRTTREWRTTTVLLLLLGVAGAVDDSTTLPPNHKSAPPTSTETTLTKIANSSTLDIEPRVNDEGLDLTPFESLDSTTQRSSTSNLPQPPTETNSSKVIVVVPSNLSAEKRASLERNRKPVIPVSGQDRGWKVMRPSVKDSYLDALDHSHSSKDPKEGIVRPDVRPKTPKIIRRDYVESPVYRPDSNPSGSYGPPKSPSITYGVPRPAVPTQQSFLPTPSDAYSLPVQSSVVFDEEAPSDSLQVTYGTPSQTAYGPPARQSPQVSYGAPSVQGPLDSYGPPSNYGLPSGYGPPSQGLPSSYGPPSGSYGPAPLPQESYGPPSSSYLPQPTALNQGYGPPAPVYGAPYALSGIPQLPSLPMIGFSWPFALKLNAFTIAKILLKLVIFKMIVKFIAVICLLLFIPKLELKKSEREDEENEGRGLNASKIVMERLNILTSMVTNSIEKHESENDVATNSAEGCKTFDCRLRRTLASGESWKDYARLLKSYVVEEMEKRRAEDESAKHETQ